MKTTRWNHFCSSDLFSQCGREGLGSTLLVTWVLCLFLDFFTYAPPKLRSEMIEAIREAVVYSHLVLLAAFDCIDDTKLVKQIIISEIISSLPNMLNDKYGRKVLLYLLSPRDPSHTVRKSLKFCRKEMEMHTARKIQRSVAESS